MKKYAIIVAGGRGTRMNTEVPKQFLLLKGKPVLMHTLEVFYQYDNNIRFIVTLPVTEIEQWQQLCKAHQFNISGNAIPVITIPESIRQIDPHGSEAADRNRFRLVQTPQVFLSTILQNAYRQSYVPEFTDDAGVVEKTGHTINLVEGNPENLKITTPTDMRIAEALLE